MRGLGVMRSLRSLLLFGKQFMNRRITVWLAVTLAFSGIMATSLRAADEAEGAKKTPTSAKAAPAKKKSLADADGPYRPLAPGVMVTIPASLEPQDTVSKHDLVEIVAADQKIEDAKDTEFRHQIWALEFNFKPMRMVWVDLPQPSGKMQKKHIWYTLYSVTNTGKAMSPVQDKSLPYEKNLGDKKKVWEIKEVQKPIEFKPEFLLEGRGAMEEGKGFTKLYPDRVIPSAVAAVQMREDPNRRLLSSVEMCRQIAVGETVWGVATWEDLDPKIKKFSVYVKGLTNAYRWKDVPGEYKPGAELGTGRRLLQKTLKLNYWRPADQFSDSEEDLRYGVPGGVDFEWVYR